MSASIRRGKTTTGQVYHEYTPGDGYVYRQYDVSGDILIVQSPKGGAGTLIPADSPKAPLAKAWNAINAQIQELKAGRREKALQIGAQVIGAVVASIPKKHRGKHKKMIKHPSADPVPDVPDPEDAPAPSVPWVPIGIGAAVIVAALAFSGGGKRAA